MLRDPQRADVQNQLAAVNAQIEQLLYRLGQEGLLDDQFAQLMQLQDEQNPNFVAEVVELYFVDSEQKLVKLEAKLGEPVVDFNDVDQLVHQFKGSSASFGAQNIAAICYSVTHQDRPCFLRELQLICLSSMVRHAGLTMSLSSVS